MTDFVQRTKIWPSSLSGVCARKAVAGKEFTDEWVHSSKPDGVQFPGVKRLLASCFNRYRSQQSRTVNRRRLRSGKKFPWGKVLQLTAGQGLNYHRVDRLQKGQAIKSLGILRDGDVLFFCQPFGKWGDECIVMPCDGFEFGGHP